MENEKWYHHRLLRRSDLFWVTFCFCCWMGGIWIHSTPTRLLSPTTKLNDLHFCRVSHQSSQQQKEKLDISWRRKRFEKTEKWCCSKSSLVTSVTRLGDFLNYPATNVFTKRSPNIWWRLELFWNTPLLKLKLLWLRFGQLSEKWGYIESLNLVTLLVTMPSQQGQKMNDGSIHKEYDLSKCT